MMLTAEEFRPGFDWVFRELAAPAALRDGLFSSVHENLYLGLSTRLKSLAAHWSPDVTWPNGMAFLQEQRRLELEDEGEWEEGDEEPEVEQRELLKLLLMRFSHVAQRIYRNQQILASYAEETFKQRHPFLVMNREPREEHAFCGRGSGIKLSCEEGLRLMQELTCRHPACACTFDPAKA